MESTVRIVSGSQAEEREGQDAAPSKKKIKLNEVAEMVLVLAAMGKMRTGRVGPTDPELGMMEEAVGSLVGVCEGFAPSEVFPGAIFGSLIDDLGLNGLKDPKPEDPLPKLSISEKMLDSKRKMEEAEKFSLPASAPLYPHFKGNLSSSPKLSNETNVSSGSLQSVGATWSSKTSPYQLPTSEMKPTVSAAQTRAAKTQMKSDPVFALPAPANYSTNSSTRTPSWAMQPHSVQPAEIGSGNQVPPSKPLKVASLRHGLSPQTTSMETKAPTATVVPPRGTKQIHAFEAHRHSEIRKIIQKILQPKVPPHRTWVPPSRAFMSEAVACQMCMANVTQINGILVCDACENGYHLKCLQSKIGDPAKEWLCRKCLSLKNNGKLLAPKYGLRRFTAKMPSSNSAAVEYNLGSSRDVSQPAKIASASTSSQNRPAADSTLCLQVSGSKPQVAISIQDNNIGAGKVEADGKIASGSSLKTVVNISDSALENSPVDNVCNEAKTVESKLDAQAKLGTDSVDHSLGLLDNHDGEMVDLKSDTIAKLEMPSDSYNKSSTVTNIQEQSSLPNCDMRVEDSKISGGGETSELGPSLKKDREDTHPNPSSDVLNVVNWVGDPLEDLKEKIHYVSCSINGHEYRAMDHVLIRFDNDKLVPSKLQTMWEDKATRQKWVTVNRYYFCGDLPETVVPPRGMESNEVCKSLSESTFPANVIESPCQVLPSKAYAEETERRKNSGTELKLHPLYMCRLIYDEVEGLLRDFPVQQS